MLAANQFRALPGSNAVLPIPRFVARVPMRRAPSLFQVHYSDRFFAVVSWSGAALAAATAAGLADICPLWTSLPIWAVLWALYPVDRRRERRDTGAWWTRSFVSELVAPVSRRPVP